MKHFSLAEWADFVRGVVTPDLGASMQKHLDEHCQSCSQTVEIWTSLSQFSEKETAYEPPASALRIAESYFLPFKLASRQTRILQLARLTLDSFERPALAGIRGGDIAPRQLMYQYGGIFVDVRVEPKPPSNLITMTGQVMDSREAESGLAGLPIALLSEVDAISEMTTNHLGEFHCSFPAARQLKLLIGMDASALLVVIPDADAEAA